MPSPSSSHTLKLAKRYQKLTHREQILLRPDTYIGSVQRNSASTDSAVWVYSESKMCIIQKSGVKYSPGFVQIFEEILVNALDHQTDPKHNVTQIKVDFDLETNQISVWNNGSGIPVLTHPEHKLYIPDMIFGHLLTSTNYDDTQKRVTGGRNGFGAKLTNIFSKKFRVDTVCAGKKFSKEWTNNMLESTDAKITENIKGADYTRIIYEPDFERFGMKSLDSDVLSILKKRVMDATACSSKRVSVYLNGERLAMKTLKDYSSLYFSKKDSSASAAVPVIIIDSFGERWEIGVTVSPKEEFMHVSFVNSIDTPEGGTHVDYITDQIVKYLQAQMKKRVKQDLKTRSVKDQLCIFLKCHIENPSFSSQTKERLTTKVSEFGTQCKLTDKFLKSLARTGIYDRLDQIANIQNMKTLSKTDGKKRTQLTGIPKLCDANKAGTAESYKCTLILTEGDSAKTFAISGLGVVGRNYWGVFPLKGKLMNTRDASVADITKNEEINTINKIMGFQQSKDYSQNISTLRYGKIMILTDADVDGSHIKGLLMNYIHYFWPSLIKRGDFVCSLATPIVKVSSGRGHNSNTLNFYSTRSFEDWKESEFGGGQIPKKYSIKYYKGLGTSTANEAKEIFKDLAKKNVNYVPDPDTDDSLVLAFDKRHADNRKDWIQHALSNPSDLDYKKLPLNVPVTDFINKDLVQFSIYDNKRSIASVVNGLKPSQRKILYATFKKNLTKETKVAQLSGYISEQTSYHHGEKSLQDTIIKMAQDFVGSNNINFLSPNGQFGTRLTGGDDAASPRYIFTELAPETRYIFHPDDDDLLEYLNDDGFSIEPEYYVPILPTLLVNGSKGVGTGYSCDVPNFSVIDIINNLRAKLNGGEFSEIHPEYEKFRGTITRDSKNKYHSHGLYRVIDTNKLEITELPLKVWTQSYKNFLEKQIEANKIAGYEDHSSEERVKFIIKTKGGGSTSSLLHKMSSEQIEKLFKLSSAINMTNMYLFDADGKIKRYRDVVHILEDFYKVRLEFYHKRRTHILNKFKYSLKFLKNKIRFIQEIMDDKLVIYRLAHSKVVELLDSRGYDKMAPEWKSEAKRSYEYLMNIRMTAFTKERIDELAKRYNSIETEYNKLKNTTPEQMWLSDLGTFEEDFYE